MKTVFLISLLMVTVDGAAPFGLAQAKNDKRASQLENEKRKLERTKSPPDRAKSLMKIAELNLSYVSDAANANDVANMKSSLDEYLKAVEAARDTMLQSGLDPQKKAGGYKAVEIALRKHLRTLQDVGRLLAVDDRESVEDTADLVSRTRDQFIHALFGPTSAK
jgi:hypothetical protein